LDEDCAAAATAADELGPVELGLAEEEDVIVVDELVTANSQRGQWPRCRDSEEDSSSLLRWILISMKRLMSKVAPSFVDLWCWT